MKVWITRYALTSGVIETDAVVCTDTCENMIDAGPHGYIHKPDWHTSRTDAESQVSKMLTHRIASLAKQNSKLRRLAVELNAKGLDAVMKTARSKRSST